MSDIKFTPRWQEELVATNDEGSLVFELTMGVHHVYFPSEIAWLQAAPEWARQKWQVYLNACRAWCLEKQIPFTIVDDGGVYEDLTR